MRELEFCYNIFVIAVDFPLLLEQGGGNFQGECALPNEKTPTVGAEMTVEVNSCVEYG